MLKMGILGGTFNPIHNGHLFLAKNFACRFHLDKVLIIPTAIPPHKKEIDLAGGYYRLEMCRKAVGDNPLFEVLDIGIQRGGVSYTYDTLNEVELLYPYAQFHLIMGADMFLTIEQWAHYAGIIEKTILCAVARDKYSLDELSQYAQILTSKYEARTEIIDFPKIDLSSTEIRKNIQEGKPIIEFVDKKVADYIFRYNLYKGEIYQIDFHSLLCERLTEKRYKHSLCVSEEAVRLAKRYGANIEKARLCGLLHDVMKDTPHEEQLQVIQKADIILSKVERSAKKLAHAISGAVYVRDTLKIADSEVYNAIRYHTTCRAGTSLLEKVIFIADFTSADRDYEDVDHMRYLADLSLTDAMLYGLSFTIKELIEKRNAIHPDTISAYNELV